MPNRRLWSCRSIPFSHFVTSQGQWEYASRNVSESRNTELHLSSIRSDVAIQDKEPCKSISTWRMHQSVQLRFTISPGQRYGDSGSVCYTADGYIEERIGVVYRQSFSPEGSAGHGKTHPPTNEHRLVFGYLEGWDWIIADDLLMDLVS